MLKRWRLLNAFTVVEFQTNQSIFYTRASLIQDRNNRGNEVNKSFLIQNSGTHTRLASLIPKWHINGAPMPFSTPTIMLSKHHALKLHNRYHVLEVFFTYISSRSKQPTEIGNLLPNLTSRLLLPQPLKQMFKV